MANEIATELKRLDVNNSNTNDKGGTEEEDVVNPWNVISKSETGIDYDKLISKYISKCVSGHPISNVGFCIAT
jgi:tryptophanyl-tRNA synthetase